jgi:hypothetical protein
MRNLAVFVPTALSRLRTSLATLLIGILVLLICPRLWFMLEAALLTALLITLAILFIARLLPTPTHLVLIGVTGHLSLLSLLCLGSTS